MMKRSFFRQQRNANSQLGDKASGLGRCYSFFTMTDSQGGFTLIEIIIAMVLIGIAVPTIMIPFSGLEDTKNPEYIVQGSFIAQKKIEELASETRATIDTKIASVCNNTTDGEYSMSCTTIDVNASDPDTSDGGSSSFAKKITLTVSRTDGLMTPMEFTTLFVVD